LRIEEKLLQTDCRNLPTPKISFWDSNKKVKYPFDINAHSKYVEWQKDPLNQKWKGKEPRDTASWDLKMVSKMPDNTFLRVASCPSFLHILNICDNPIGHKDTSSKVELVKKFGYRFVACLQVYGIKIKAGNLQNVQSVSGNQQTLETKRTQLCNRLRKAWEAIPETNATNSSAPAPDIVLVALASSDAGVYADVRWWADCEMGLPCICVSPEGVAKGAKPDLAMLGNLA